MTCLGGNPSYHQTGPVFRRLCKSMAFGVPRRLGSKVSFTNATGLRNIKRNHEDLRRTMRPKINRTDGFVSPAESARHLATILCFPSQCSMPAGLLQASREEIISISAAIAEFEPVRLHVRTEEIGVAHALLKDTRRKDKDKMKHPIDLIECPVNHPWVRDTGPVYVFPKKQEEGLDRRRCAFDFNFNEWGHKVPSTESAQNAWGQTWPIMSSSAQEENARLASRISALDQQPSTVEAWRAPITLEGGSISVDGEGTLMITKVQRYVPNEILAGRRQHSKGSSKGF